MSKLKLRQNLKSRFAMFLALLLAFALLPVGALPAVWAEEGVYDVNAENTEASKEEDTEQTKEETDKELVEDTKEEDKDESGEDSEEKAEDESEEEAKDESEEETKDESEEETKEEEAEGETKAEDKKLDEVEVTSASASVMAAAGDLVKLTETGNAANDNNAINTYITSLKVVDSEGNPIVPTPLPAGSYGRDYYYKNTWDNGKDFLMPMPIGNADSAYHVYTTVKDQPLYLVPGELKEDAHLVLYYSESTPNTTAGRNTVITAIEETVTKAKVETALSGFKPYPMTGTNNLITVPANELELSSTTVQYAYLAAYKSNATDAELLAYAPIGLLHTVAVGVHSGVNGKMTFVRTTLGAESTSDYPGTSDKEHYYMGTFNPRDKIKFTATPDAGYKVSKVTYINADGQKAELTLPSDLEAGEEFVFLQHDDTGETGLVELTDSGYYYEVEFEYAGRYHMAKSESAKAALTLEGAAGADDVTYNMYVDDAFRVNDAGEKTELLDYYTLYLPSADMETTDTVTLTLSEAKTLNGVEYAAGEYTVDLTDLPNATEETTELSRVITTSTGEGGKPGPNVFLFASTMVRFNVPKDESGDVSGTILVSPENKLEDDTVYVVDLEDTSTLTTDYIQVTPPNDEDDNPLKTVVTYNGSKMLTANTADGKYYLTDAAENGQGSINTYAISYVSLAPAAPEVAGNGSSAVDNSLSEEIKEATDPDKIKESLANETTGVKIDNDDVGAEGEKTGFTEAQETAVNEVVAGLDTLIEESTLSGTAKENVTVEVKSYLDIQFQGLTMEATTPSAGGATVASKAELTLDIKPMTKVTMTANKGATDGTEKKVDLPAEEMKVTKPVKLTIPLPKGFVSGAGENVFIRHQAASGAYIYQAKSEADGTGFKVSFTNPHGFSTFVLSTESGAVLEYDADGPNSSSAAVVPFLNLQAAVQHLQENGIDGATLTLLGDLVGEAVTVTEGMKFTVDTSDGEDGNYEFTPVVKGGTREADGKEFLVTEVKGTDEVTYYSGKVVGVHTTGFNASTTEADKAMEALFKVVEGSNSTRTVDDLGSSATANIMYVIYDEALEGYYFFNATDADGKRVFTEAIEAEDWLSSYWSFANESQVGDFELTEGSNPISVALYVGPKDATNDAPVTGAPVAAESEYTVVVDESGNAVGQNYIRDVTYDQEDKKMIVAFDSKLLADSLVKIYKEGTEGTMVKEIQVSAGVETAEVLVSAFNGQFAEGTYTVQLYKVDGTEFGDPMDIEIVKASFNLDGGTIDPATAADPIYLQAGDEITLPTGATKTDYTPLGWKAGTVTTPGGGKVTLDASTEFTAQWALKAATVTLNVNKDGVPWTGHGKTFTLVKGTDSFGGTGADGTVTFALDANNAGVYEVYYRVGNGTPVAARVTVNVDTTAESATVNFYTVTLTGMTAGTTTGVNFSATYDGATINSGDAVHAGGELVVTARGVGASTYTYKWSDGCNTAICNDVEVNSMVTLTCVVTGTTTTSNNTGGGSGGGGSRGDGPSRDRRPSSSSSNNDDESTANNNTNTEDESTTGNQGTGSGTQTARPSGPSGSTPFTDVSANEWFAPAVSFVYQRGLMAGVSGNSFAPQMKLNRATMVQLLWNLEGNPAAGAPQFTDVASGVWYGQAVAWASENGIVSGMGNNIFAPDNEITREQMASMLYRYCQFKGIALPVVRDTDFSDTTAVSAYAQAAAQAMYQAGILNGQGANMFAPQGTATRAEVAQTIYSFITALE